MDASSLMKDEVREGLPAEASNLRFVDTTGARASMRVSGVGSGVDEGRGYFIAIISASIPPMPANAAEYEGGGGTPILDKRRGTLKVFFADFFLNEGFGMVMVVVVVCDGGAHSENCSRVFTS